MKKITQLLSIALYFWFFTGYAQLKQVIPLSQAKVTQTELVRNANDGFEIKSSLSKIILENKSFDKGNFVKLNAAGLIKTFNKGLPDLPVYSKLIEVPQDAEVKIEVISYDVEIVDLNEKGVTQKIVPAQPSMRKDKSTQPFYINDAVYHANKFFKQGEIAIYEESGQMRDKRLGRIEIRPFQYNPVTNQLKVLNNLKIKFEFVGANMPKTESLRRKYGSIHSALPSSNVAYHLDFQTKEFIDNMPITYVIVADRAYEAALQDFVAWKTKKGFHVIEAYTDDPNVGNTVASIKAYCQNLYNNPPAGVNPLSYLLVVGDIDVIPATQHSEVNDSPYTDLDLAEYTGDYLPEVNFGRWSVDNAQQVTDIVAKTIKYEKLQMADIGYLHETLLVAGDDESHEDTYGGGAIWYADHYYMNAAHNINSHTFLQNEIETWPGVNAQAHDSIMININNGVSLANYTAHCGPDGWSAPSFSQSDLNNVINNDDKYGLWIGNCCQSLKFDENEAFGEIAIRKPNAGVIGYIGGSQYTYWSEDYYWGTGVGAIVEQPDYNSTSAGVYDANFHDGINEINDLSTWYLSSYQMVKAGNLAVEASTSSLKPYYWVIYQLAGDPSIIPYIGTPQPMAVNPSPSALILGATTLNVTAAPYAYVALSQNGVLVAAASTDASGNATLNFDSSDLSVGDADLVVTAQNRMPYINTISVVPANNPYVSLDSFTTTADPDFGQTIDLNVTLKNLATAGSGYDAFNVSATLSSTDPYVTITDNTEDFGTINAGDTQTVNNSYTITIADNVPDQHIIHFDLEITGTDSANTSYTWNGNLSITANAPDISIDDLAVLNDDNNDGILDPGEHGDLSFTVTNTGHADANFNGELIEVSDPNNYLTLGTTQIAPVNIAAGSSTDFVFTNASADAATPLGSPVDIKLTVNAGDSDQYTDESTQTLVIGVIPIYNISDGGTLSVCTGTFYDSGLDTGNYGDSEDYTMTFLAPANGFVHIDFNSFEVENNYDFLYVYYGTDTSGTPVTGSPFTGTNSPGLLSSAEGLTFRFTSDSSQNKPGWSADVSCSIPTTAPACAVNPVPNDGATNVFPTTLSWDAVLDAASYDVYFGTDTNPLNNTPVNVVSNFYALSPLSPNTTYYWTVTPKNNLGDASNCNIWSFTTGAAQYFMTDGATITTCDGVFYDTGGPNDDYNNDEDSTMTFLPGNSGDVLEFYFSMFDVEISNSGTHYDWLKVYDGVDTNAPLLGDFAADDGAPVPTELQPIRATNTQGALTFQFHSDGSVTKSGWEAQISCVDPGSINELDNVLGIYPNPTEGLFTIKSKNLNDAELYIYSLSGQEILKTQIDNDAFVVDLRKNAKGLYFVKIISDNKTAVYKVILK